MTAWEEVGDGVFCRRYQPWDVTVGAVRGRDGLLVVDTRASPAQADELLSDLRALDPLSPAWVVNTHAHFDHTFGNARFPGAEVWAHQSVPAALREGRHDAPADPEYQGVTVVEPDRLVSAHVTLDLGDRVAELRHLGPAHTDGDLVVWIPDVGVLFAGDLVEESGPPAYGSDSFPLEWPEALARLVEWPADGDLLVVPGHGAVVGRQFIERQRADVAAVARILQELWEAGVPQEEALDAAADRWPWPAEQLGHALRRAYASLSGGGGIAG